VTSCVACGQPMAADHACPLCGARVESRMSGRRVSIDLMVRVASLTSIALFFVAIFLHSRAVAVECIGAGMLTTPVGEGMKLERRITRYRRSRDIGVDWDHVQFNWLADAVQFRTKRRNPGWMSDQAMIGAALASSSVA
jgi:hypothetical protein